MIRSVSGCPSEKYKNRSLLSWRTAPKQASAFSASLGLGWRCTRCSSSPLAAQLCILGWAKRLNQHSSWSISSQSECNAAQAFSWSRLFFGAHSARLDCVSGVWPDANRCPSRAGQHSHCAPSPVVRQRLPTNSSRPATPVSRRWPHAQTDAAISGPSLATALVWPRRRHFAGRAGRETSHTTFAVI